MIKVVCLSFLPIVTHTGVLHRTFVIRIFMYWKNFKLISLALKILETRGYTDSALFDPKKIDDKNCLFKVSFYWDSQ
jgi:hypothetical protein